MAKKDDYGYFGKGTEGYVHYKQAFDESQKQEQSPAPRRSSSSGLPSGCGCLGIISIIIFIGIFVQDFDFEIAFEAVGYFLVAIFILWKIFIS